MIVSRDSGNGRVGKTMLATGLALAAVRRGANVVLVDQAQVGRLGIR